MIDTVMFDLDGTLLPLDSKQFITIYFDELGKAFANLIEPQKLKNYILTATQAMVANLEYRTNETVFMDTFQSLIGSNLELYQARFATFYEQGFLKAQAAATHFPIISKTIKLLKDKGYNLIVVTNPLFPKQAVLHGIHWAGLDPDDFSYITSFEENHYCKPQLQFYQEVLEHIERRPEQCLMVGNDVSEDLAAGKLGIKTFLITDCLIHHPGDEIICDYQGKYEDLHRFAKVSPDIKQGY